jgi:hypothetical protein
MSLVGYLAILATQLDRARRTTTSRFEDGVWGQRLEQVSFVALPQNLMVLVPAVACALVAAALARGLARDLWLDRLVRAAAGTAFVALVLAVVALVEAVLVGGDSANDFASVVNRVGGALMAIAMIRLCLQAERERPRPTHDDL